MSRKIINYGTCETCAFYVEGLCHRHPPHPTLQIENEHSSWDGRWCGIEIKTYYVYPEVEKEDWCGEYKFNEDLPHGQNSEKSQG